MGVVWRREQAIRPPKLRQSRTMCATYLAVSVTAMWALSGASAVWFCTMPLGVGETGTGRGDDDGAIRCVRGYRMNSPLKQEFQAELQLAAGGLGAAEFAEFGVVVVAGRAGGAADAGHRRAVGAGQAEGGRVGEVEGLGTELEAHAVGERDFFEEGEVEVD